MTSTHTTLRIADPGELIASVPALIGFRPHDSLVLIALGGASGRRVGLTLRIDLPPPEQVRDAAEYAVTSLLADVVDGAVVVVIGTSAGPGPARPDVAAAVVDALEDRGVTVHAVVGVDRILAGAQWRCYESCGCRGVLPDPRATAAAVTAVAQGRVVLADRSELQRLVEPGDAERVRHRELLLIGVADRALAGRDPGADGDAMSLAVVEAALADAGAGTLVLDDDRVVALAAALVRPTVRDAALERSAPAGSLPTTGGPAGAGAETLWAALCRELPDPEAAEAAALLAASALMRGDGALANVALDRAEQSWPGHRLAGLLRSVASLGLRPAQVRAGLLGGAGPTAAAGPTGAGGPDGRGRP